LKHSLICFPASSRPLRAMTRAGADITFADLCSTEAVKLRVDGSTVAGIAC
jgi:hypothetical protein